jgi:hypothetical protein
MCDKYQLGTDLKSNIEFKQELLQSEKVVITLKQFHPGTDTRKSLVGCVIGFASLGNATFLNVGHHYKNIENIKLEQWSYRWINIDHIAEIYLD